MTKRKPMMKLETIAEHPKYRYYCDACSNDAFYSDKMQVMVNTNCQHCGKQIMTRLENYLPNDR